MASPSDGPSWEDIERAWVRGRPAPPAWRRARHRWNGRYLAAFAIVWMLLIVGFEACVILDVVFGFGWGYRPVDALYGLLMIVGGGFVFAFIWLIHRLVGWLGGVGED